MAFSGVGQIIEVRNTGQVITRLNLFKKNLVRESYTTSREIMQYLKGQAVLVIRQKKASTTTGFLEGSIYYDVRINGEKSIIFTLKSSAPYAEKMQSGYQPYVERNISPLLLKWVSDNLGDGAARSIEQKKKMRIGFPSESRPYDPQTGMRFFDDPFARMIGEIPSEFYKAVDRARRNAQV